LHDHLQGLEEPGFPGLLFGFAAMINHPLFQTIQKIQPRP
jgi:hypothetical protein